MTDPTGAGTPAADAHYDLIIVGSGSGNSLPAPGDDATSIAIVEEGRFGGTCLNVGCIPTKMHVHAADVALAVRRAHELGVPSRVEDVDWPAIRERVFGRRVDPISRGGEEYRRGPETPNIDVYDGHARFVGPRTLRTSDGGEARVISGERIVLAAGSRPAVPAVFRESGAVFRTNEDIMRLERQPESLVIVGGGYIAMEFAHVFASFGTRVTILARSTLLRTLDADISERFNAIADRRYDVRRGRTVTALREAPGGMRELTLDDGSTLRAEEVLVATGRIPNGDLLDPAAGGVELHDDGRVRVDEYGRTTAPGVWALGDVSSPHQLKHVANAELRAVRHNLDHPDDLRPMPHRLVPAAIFTHPQIATVGLTEAGARAAGHDVAVKVQAYGDVAYGWAMEETEGIVKLIAGRRSGRLLGAHLMGPEAATLIHQLITIMAFGIDVRDAARDQYWIHPALPEVVENALLGLDLPAAGPDAR